MKRCQELLAWLIPTLDTFPRNRRFTLGERLDSGLLEVLELVVEAAYSRERVTLLAQANRHMSVLRHLWRLSFELKVLSMSRYEHGVRGIESLGRQVGAWRKASGQ